MGKRLIDTDESFFKLCAYIDEHRQPGAVLAYAELEQATGVLMDRKGREKLRKAILYSRLEYKVDRGHAFQLAEPSTTREILAEKIMRIDSRIKRAERARAVMAQAFWKMLPEEDRKRMLFMQAIFGAIQLEADKGRKGLYGPKTPAISGPLIPPTLPES